MHLETIVHPEMTNMQKYKWLNFFNIIKDYLIRKFF